jgi:hypothetical protein
LLVVGAVTLVQAERTKEAMARTRRAIGRRDIGGFLRRRLASVGTLAGGTFRFGIIGSRLSA